MIKSLVLAAAVTIGLASYAIAQETSPGAPAGNAPITQEPPAPAAPAMHHHMHHYHHHMHHYARHYHHPMHHNMATSAPAPEAPK
jgi:hypothetical protein